MLLSSQDNSKYPKCGPPPVAGGDKAAAADGAARERALALADLKQEIGLLCQLRHPHICMLLGYSLSDGREVMPELVRCLLLAYSAHALR